MGVYSTSQFTGAFLGGTLGGLLLQMAGLEGVIGLMVISLVLWLLVALTMPVPQYTTSLTVPLHEVAAARFDEIDENLRNLVGVKDVVIVEDGAVAYLKVDRQDFNQDQLAHLDFVRQGNNS